MSVKSSKQASSTVFWFDSDRRAWSANEAVRQAAIKYQTKSDKSGGIISGIGLGLTVICTIIATIITGNSSEIIATFFTFFLIFAGLVMLSGNITRAFSNT